MSTILSNYSLRDGNTTSSTFTFAGSARELSVSIYVAGITGYNTYARVQTSSDEVLWIDVPGGIINLQFGSDTYVYHLTESEGAYVRVILEKMDSQSGTVTIDAEEPSSSSGGALTYRCMFSFVFGGGPVIIHEQSDIGTPAANGLDGLFVFEFAPDTFLNKKVFIRGNVFGDDYAQLTTFNASEDVGDRININTINSSGTSLTDGFCSFIVELYPD